MNYQTTLLLLIATFVGTGIYNITQEASIKPIQDEIHTLFEEWKSDNLLSFQNPQEHSYRLSVFQDNIKYIKEINAKQSNFELGLNKFATLSKEEFKQLYLQNTKQNPTDSEKQPSNLVSIEEIPNEFSWQGKGVLTPVVDEGKCDASYALSSLGVLQANYVIKNQGPLTEFSAQDILSCNNFGAGCNGGSVDKTLHYLLQTGKVYTEASYPYTSSNGEIAACKSDKEAVPGFQFQMYYDDQPREEGVNVLKRRVSKSLVSSGIDGHNLQFYKGGVYDNCGLDRNVDMLVVGYTADYWEIKTPFGTNWGEQGYLKLKMGNTCGVAVQFFSTPE